jgi:hypothetical protein
MGAMLLAVVLALPLGVAMPGRVAAFSGFGTSSADATFGEAMTFRVELPGGAPERLELLLRFGGDEGTFVAPVAADGEAAEYVWDTADRFLTPNTSVAYRWRALDGGRTTLSAERSLLYDDDRAGLDWRTERFGEATVHWYGGAESQARRFGELSADGAARAEALLGHEMTAPVDIFVYDSQDDFFGALGPGAREWTGAATYPQIRTIFMWLGGGPSDYLETTIVHEVTHVVFNDATDNPFHEPAKWLNEGIAVWSERGSADTERAAVEFEASGGGLFAFPAIAEQFPIGSRGATLSYAQGATMVDMIIDEHGEEALASIAAAYREGASDDEALQAGTGLTAEALYAGFYEAFGVAPPQPVEPAPIPPSNVRLPGAAASGEPDPVASPAPGSSSPAGPGSPSDGDGQGLALLVVGAVVVVVVLGAATWWAARRVRRSEPS